MFKITQALYLSTRRANKFNFILLGYYKKLMPRLCLFSYISC
ncbi:MAG: hypothetical protein JWQ84_3496 [Mucilaginibacter sp.]|nr:hypothetical protein [Mucilaginibacter sp.]